MMHCRGGILQGCRSQEGHPEVVSEMDTRLVSLTAELSEQINYVKMLHVPHLTNRKLRRLKLQNKQQLNLLHLHMCRCTWMPNRCYSGRGQFTLVVAAEG